MNIILILSTIGIIILLIIAIIILRIIIKRKNRLLIPEEVLSDFNKAEEMLRNSKGKLTPQQILWKIYNEKSGCVLTTETRIEPSQEINQPKENKLRKLFKR